MLLEQRRGGGGTVERPLQRRADFPFVHLRPVYGRERAQQRLQFWQRLLEPLQFWQRLLEPLQVWRGRCAGARGSGTGGGAVGGQGARLHDAGHALLAEGRPCARGLGGRQGEGARTRQLYKDEGVCWEQGGAQINR